jgi:hypothetical protein
MASLGGPNIITNGLVLQLDAANAKSYPRSGTTLFDTNGSNPTNFTLKSSVSYSPTANGSFLLANNSNGYLNTSTNTKFIPGTGNFAAEIWFYIPNGLVNNTGYLSNAANLFNGTTVNAMEFVIVGSGSVSTQPYIVAMNQYGTGRSSVFAYLTGSITISTTQWNHVVFTRTSSTASIYINSQLLAVSSSTIDYSTCNNMCIGGSDNTGYPGYLSGSISNVRMYNRGLSASEVAQNYNATKARFNL